MNNRFISAVPDSAGQSAGQFSKLAVITRNAAIGFRTIMRHAVMTTGIVAICVLGFMFVKPDTIDHIKALSPFATDPVQQALATKSQLANLMAAPEKTVAAAPVTAPAPASAASRLDDNGLQIIGTSAEQDRVTKWLSRRYRVAQDATNMLVSAAYLNAHQLKLDPLLILSVMAIESRFNPFAESPVGAQGLMQVMSKVHHEKFQKLGGVQAALNPVANIQVGAQILKEYVRRGGSVEAGLKMYVGAANLETDFGYGAKVLAEYSRLKNVAAGKRVSIYSTVASRAAPKKIDNAIAAEKPSALTQAEPTSDETPV